MLPLLASLAVAAAPQGVSVHLASLTAAPSDAGNARAVEAGLRKELEAQGYAVLEGEAAKGAAARVEGAVQRSGSGSVLVTVRLLKTTDSSVLSEEKATVMEAGGFEAAGTRIARELASELRHTFGVRVKVKL